MIFINKFAETLQGNICGNNIDKVMRIGSQYAQYVDPSVGFLIAYVLMLIVMVWTLLTFPWNVLRSLSFWLSFLEEIVKDIFHNNSN